jgi:hypothetical protein
MSSGADWTEEQRTTIKSWYLKIGIRDPMKILRNLNYAMENTPVAYDIMKTVCKGE